MTSSQHVPKRSRMRAISSLLLGLFFSFFTKSAQAVDLTDIPENLADQLGIGEFAGGVLASAILLFIFILPTTIIARSKTKNPAIAEILVGVLILVFCVVVTWLDYWIVLITIVLIAGLYAFRMSDILGGGKGGS